MPVWLDRGALGCRLFAVEPRSNDKASSRHSGDNADWIELGLLNNMSDSALEQTERQILRLLHDAAEGLSIRLRLYALPAVSRGEWGQKHLARLHYYSANDLWNSNLDGLIITGAEPRTEDLTQEAYWHELVETFDWANENTISSVMSCLAVHAAVLHFDGIDRTSLEQKCFGLFKFEKVGNNPLLEGTQKRLLMPHSRLNEITERALVPCNYEILTKSEVAGVDTFVKKKRSLFVFFQGHPEYEPWTLLGEYRRDIGRYLSGERDTYPLMPQAYFDADSTLALTEFRDRAIAKRQIELMTTFPTDRLVGTLKDHWHTDAVQLYHNWLQQLVARKSDRSRSVRASMIEAASERSGR